MSYVELHARSAFSFLEGASIPEDLIARCAELEIPAIALLDRNSISGVVRFHQQAKKSGVRAIIGAEIAAPEGFRYGLLAESQKGYQNLCRLITKIKLRTGHGEQENAVAHPADLAEHAEGLVCLTGGDEGPLAYALNRKREPRMSMSGPINTAHLQNDNDALAQIRQLTDIFGQRNVFVELQRHYDRAEEFRNQAALAIARKLKLPLLATNGVSHAFVQDRDVLDALTCVRHKTTIHEAGQLLARNSERHLKHAKEMETLFADLPEAVANTRHLAARLGFTLRDLGYKFPEYPVPPGETMNSYLRQLADAGARERYRPYHEKAQRQIERELAMIEKLELAGYFLIVWDIVRFAREQGLLVQGRGSAANSAVCYALKITAIDPVGMDLLFERFLSEERGEWPDIDLDLASGDERERAIQYVYERYGKLGAAMTANVITYRGRSAARDVGKVLGFETETLDRLSKVVPYWGFKDKDDTAERQFKQAGVDLQEPLVRKFLSLYQRVQDLPRHLGQHSGGMVICAGQLDSIVPLQPATMPGRFVIQWDKEDCADMGIVKVDLLGLGMMAVIQESLGLIRTHYGEPVDLAHLPAGDPAVYAALQQADTVGMFQVESRAQMSFLPAMRPDKFYDIVVQVAIIRPGPIVGKMLHPYLRRRQGLERVSYPHPALEPVLARTLGVPLFQEQLLRMAMIVAGFTGGEAEELRRAMGFKRSEKRMQEIESRLREGMTHNGIDKDTQDLIVRSIGSFAAYGFPESHAASFALLAYASAYLKCRYLAAFTAAILNNQPMGFYHSATLVKDAQRHGLHFKPVDVARSEWVCTLERGQGPNERGQRSGDRGQKKDVRGQGPEARGQEKDVRTQERNKINLATSLASNSSHSHLSHDVEERTESVSACPLTPDVCPLLPGPYSVRLGFNYLKGFRKETAAKIVEERSRGVFTSIRDLVRRVPAMRKEELDSLAEAGALNFMGTRRGQGPGASERGQEPGARGQGSGARRGQGPGARGQDGSDTDLTVHFPAHSHLSRDVEHHTKSVSPVPCPLSPGPSFLSPVPWPLLHRRDALWRAELAMRPVGELLEHGPSAPDWPLAPDPCPLSSDLAEEPSPLAPMTPLERLAADYRITGLTIGAHPMRLHREEMNRLHVIPAAGLASVPDGRRVRIAGAVICRQRPGTANGFVFISLEDETGISNAIVLPDLFEARKLTIVDEPFLLIEGILQNQRGSTSVKADRIDALRLDAASLGSHDFH